ncbi:MAG: hypothetical protein FWG96_00035 [Methanomassiliicoccaceae archaeon]|nr:hypothetical protein [Methanomassiliicoccaceae archaeon]
MAAKRPHIQLHNKWILAVFVAAMFAFVPFALHDSAELSGADSDGNPVNDYLELIPEIKAGNKVGISLDLNVDRFFEIAKIAVAETEDLLGGDPMMDAIIKVISDSKNMNEAMEKLSEALQDEGAEISGLRIDKGSFSMDIEFLVTEKTANGYKMSLTYSLFAEAGVTVYLSPSNADLIGFGSGVVPTGSMSASVSLEGKLDLNLTPEFIPRTVESSTVFEAKMSLKQNFKEGYDYVNHKDTYTYASVVNDDSMKMEYAFSFGFKVGSSDLTTDHLNKALNGESVTVTTTYSFQAKMTENGTSYTDSDSGTTSFDLADMSSGGSTSTINDEAVNNILSEVWKGNLPTFNEFRNAFGADIANEIGQIQYNQTMNQIREPFKAAMSVLGDSESALEENGALNWYYEIGDDVVHSGGGSSGGGSSGGGINMTYVAIGIVAVIAIVGIAFFARGKI